MVEGVEVELEGGDPSGGRALVLDDARLGQVLSNLVSNALKFTPAGGKVAVTADLLGSLLRLTVADSGPGVDLTVRAL